MGVKAFELVPAIEKLTLMQATQITCLEYCGKNLYVGTDDCFIVHFFISESISPNGRNIIRSEKQGHKYLGLKKPIVQVKAVSAINRIIYLCDNSLQLLSMLDLENIPGSNRVKNAVLFQINENPVKSSPFSVEIAVALKKRAVQLFVVTEDKFTQIKEISIPEPLSSLGISGAIVCGAGSSQYFMANVENNKTQDLFPYNSDSTSPFVLQISKDEFLLSAPSALGMFITTQGVTKRPPLQWSDNLTGIAYSHPYILALNDEFITIHSISDQLQKQSIPFSSGIWLGHYSGHILVASANQIYMLLSIPIQQQIEGLLADKKVEEALDLAKISHKTGVDKEKFAQTYQRIQQQAGFIEFQRMNLHQARELFLISHIDIRELISLYPFLLPNSSQYNRSIPPLHEIADINQLTQGDEDKILKYKLFLLDYLEEVRETARVKPVKLELDTALLKLYAETNSQHLMSLIVSESSCNIDDCDQWLSKFGHHHALGLLYNFHGNNDKALEVWMRLVNNEINDKDFPGFDFVVQVLTNLPDPHTVWKYADNILKKDEVVGVKIFTERTKDEIMSEKFESETIIVYLQKFSIALRIYLEFLVFTQKVEDAFIHTELTGIYLDNVLVLMSNENSPEDTLHNARSFLQKMLQTSSFYEKDSILKKIRNTELYQEQAIVFSKLEQHDKALHILVNKLKDYKAAERYCIISSKDKDSSYRQKLYHMLLSLYVDPQEGFDVLVGPAVSLLNSKYADFDTTKVLQILPSNWSLSLLGNFLSKSVRSHVNNLHTSKLKAALARSSYYNAKLEAYTMLKETISINEEICCEVCKESLTDVEFVRYPNGVITHTKCARNLTICPKTGQLFCTKS